MALIAMAVYDTEENKRSEYTKEVISTLVSQGVHEEHTLVVIDNNSCKETKDFLHDYSSLVHTIYNKENVGTAKAINQAWALRKPNQHLIKMDNDCVVNYSGWVDEMEEAIERDKQIGILGLKRKDLLENPNRTDQFKSTLRMLPHQNGESWIIVEDVEHVMGTCQMYNYRLIDKIGGLMQPGVYGFDDTLSAVRCKLAGFKNSFLPHIDIDHIDTKENPYWQTKRDLAMNDMAMFNAMKDRMIRGEQSIKVDL
jgi:GT2 family glycosyltransferase